MFEPRRVHDTTVGTMIMGEGFKELDSAAIWLEDDSLSQVRGLLASRLRELGLDLREAGPVDLLVCVIRHGGSAEGPSWMRQSEFVVEFDPSGGAAAGVPLFRTYGWFHSEDLKHTYSDTGLPEAMYESRIPGDLEQFIDEVAESVREGNRLSEAEENRRDQLAHISDAGFRIHSFVDDGGQAEVWSAVAVNGARVAVKILKDVVDDRSVKRFSREVRRQIGLEHPHTVSVVYNGMDANPPFYVMPFAERSLAEAVADSAFGQDDALDAFGVLLDAMVYAHKEGLIHRDLKPQNVLQVSGVWQVAHFGFCRSVNGADTTRLTATGEGFGTPAYSAPEQFTDAHVADERADIYALGKVLYNLLTRESPYPTVHLSKVPDPFGSLVDRCCREEPAKRFHTVAELQSAFISMRNPASFHNPGVTARGCIKALNAGSGDFGSLRDLLLANRADESLILGVLPELTPAAAERAAAEDLHGLIQLVNSYVELLPDQNRGFAYADQAGNFLAAVYQAPGMTLDARSRALGALLSVAHANNRYNAVGLFWRLVEASNDPGHISIVVDVLTQDPNAASWAAEHRNSTIALPSLIAQALQQSS